MVVTRRTLLKATLASLAMPSGPARAGVAQPPLLFGTTPVILDEQAEFLARWRSYLETLLRRPLRFVQRGSYREILLLLAEGKLDCAWLCGYGNAEEIGEREEAQGARSAATETYQVDRRGSEHRATQRFARAAIYSAFPYPYVRMRDRLELVAVPVYDGQPLYRSYLIVPSGERSLRTILDLRGQVFAFSDPDSNSGWLVPQVELKRAGEDASRFFKKSFYTWGHRKVIEAVAAGLARGGAVDGYIWDSLARLHPHLTGATRLAWRSPEYGFPPIVARRGAEGMDALRQALLNMSGTPSGQALLARLNLDGFVPGSPGLFDGIETNWRYLGT